YMASYLNEGTVAKKLQKEISSLKTMLEGKDKMIAEQKALVESVSIKAKAAQDRLVRNKVMEELLSPLANEKRKVMAELLESVKTENLKAVFGKYIDAVLNESI